MVLHDPTPQLLRTTACRAAGRGAYTISGLPDLCFGIASGCLGHLDPEIGMFPLKAPASPPGPSFISCVSAGAAEPGGKPLRWSVGRGKSRPPVRAPGKKLFCDVHHIAGAAAA
jgi:hypothetical protein